MPGSRRIAVVSPFLDKRHGTERCIAEQVERLARDYGYDVHIYSQRVEDLEGVLRGRAAVEAEPDVRDGTASLGAVRGGRLVWHKVPAVPGPGLVKYVWWFAANHTRRWWDTVVRGARYDLLYSPGINCLDADAVVVHIVFAEFHERVKSTLLLRRNPVAGWPRVVHRRLYYRLIIALERRVYPRMRLALAAVSGKTAHDLDRFYGRNGDVAVVHNAVDIERFSPAVRERLRARARRELQLPDEAFVLLLIGNDWKKKGLTCLLEAMEQLRNRHVRLLVIGRDDLTPFAPRIRSYQLASCVHFPPPRPDVQFYYAAGDAYVGPSLEDAFALPPLEAMACGLPVIVSKRAGVSEIVTDGVDALLLKDPTNVGELTGLVRRLIEERDLRHRLGEAGVHTARQHTWERNAAETVAFLESAMRRRRQS
jgi:UDP-glucose:(heptosyl)LPS alpha-1,3-glucosyltransferase